MPPIAPVTLAIMNDHELIVRGVSAMLADHQDRVQVLEIAADAVVVQSVDIVLYDAFTHTSLNDPELRSVLTDPNVGKVVVYTWALDEELVARAQQLGVAASLSKSLSAKELADELVSIHTHGGQVRPVGSDDAASGVNDWPGREYGLTGREAEVIALITTGLSNQQIAERTHLSINSIKSYIRSAYRTMDVTTRSQAVLWGIDHGMRPRATRALNPAR